MRKRIYIDGTLADSVEGLDVHIGNRLRVDRGKGTEVFTVANVSDTEIRLRSESFNEDFPTRVESSLWDGI